MLTINFYSDSDSKDFESATKEYEQIWKEDGARIVSVWEKSTNLKFVETYVNAIVFHHISRSHPLSLRYDIPFERKKSVLVHELGHRILFGK